MITKAQVLMTDISIEDWQSKQGEILEKFAGQEIRVMREGKPVTHLTLPVGKRRLTKFNGVRLRAGAPTGAETVSQLRG